MSSPLPLVTCIMPTRKRSEFVPSAIDCFLRQDYPRKQLLIFEEESSSSVPASADIRHVQTNINIYNSIGEKRNAMCSVADGELIAHWDDDDWHAPNRLSTQIGMMLAQGARLCGADRLVFLHNCAHGLFTTHTCPFNIAQSDHPHAWLFRTVRRPWLAGGTLVYERSLWQEHPFTEVSNGEDVAFIDAAHRCGVKIAAVSDPSLYVAMLHDRNTTTRNVDSQWSSFEADTVRQWMR